jgi:hypothetical protein
MGTKMNFIAFAVHCLKVLKREYLYNKHCKKINEFWTALDNGNFGWAENTLHGLEDILGSTDPFIVGANTTLYLEKD